MIQSQTEEALVERMKARDLDSEVINEFTRRVDLIKDGYNGKVPWEEVENPGPEDLVFLEDLSEPTDPKSDLSKLVIIKLNGGLGTSMGLTAAKSVIKIHENKSFLHYMKEQILFLRKKYSVDIPLLFMNSFNTRTDTLAAPGISTINSGLRGNIPVDFLQNMIPRINAKTYLPVGTGLSDADWCPPGHGDIFLSLKITGILDRLLQAGFRTAFISNSDNLAATVDTALLSHFNRENLEFAMEITPKTLADVKGGVLIRRNHGGQSRIELLEAAQVDPEYMDDFKDIKRFSYFNTNNLWVNLEALKEKLEGPGLSLPVIVNPKTVDGTDVLQLETAMGAAIGQFERTKGYVIPRNRFAPVKSCTDLLIRRSDAYRLKEDGTLVRNAPPGSPEPVVKLDDSYKSLTDFERLFPVIPSLKNLTSLKISGPVLFDRAVSLEGDVVLENPGKEAVSIHSSGKTKIANESIRFS